MDSKVPVELEQNSIFKRIAKFIKQIFNNEKNIKNITAEEKSLINDNNQINELYRIEIPKKISSNIIKEANKKRKLDEIIQIIESNPETLEKLDIHKLEIVDNYYKEQIKEYKKKIENAS